MSDTTRNELFTIRLGEITLGEIARRMLVRAEDPFTATAARSDDSDQDLSRLPADVQGVLYRSLKVDAPQDLLKIDSKRIRYTPRQYERYFATLSTPYDEYLESFSAKSRSNLRRKVRKFDRASGGATNWKRYKSAEEMDTFYRLARKISKQSYQERLLDAGLPDHEAFQVSMHQAATEGRVRGYIIFLDEEAVAYLYCPIQDGVVKYAYLGYVSKFNDLSPGTVLLWLATEDLFNEGCHRIFDFTEGGDRSKHSQKRLFATDSVTCADIYVLRPNLSNFAVVFVHAGTEWVVERIGRFLEVAGVKRFVRHASRRLWGAGPRAADS